MKKAARLNSSLLARKGFASPAAAVPMFGKANHYGHMHHHHIRDVVYDHVDPDDGAQVDLDPQQAISPVNEAIQAPMSGTLPEPLSAGPEQEATPRGLMRRVQESLRSLHFQDSASEFGKNEDVARTPQDLAAQTGGSAGVRRSTAADASELPEGCCKANPAGKRVAMTLRLDPGRHLRLRVLSAHVNRSSQDILTEALDGFLDQFAHMPEMRQCDCLRGEADDKG